MKYLILCLSLFILLLIPHNAHAETSPHGPYDFTNPVLVRSYISTVFGERMASVVKCESRYRQFDSLGNVLIHKNTDGTTDIGIFQINSTHLKEAELLGLDLNDPIDNVSFGKYLFFNTKRGIHHWVCAKTLYKV